jgi:hypothetical protein
VHWRRIFRSPYFAGSWAVVAAIVEALAWIGLPSVQNEHGRVLYLLSVFAIFIIAAAFAFIALYKEKSELEALLKDQAPKLYLEYTDSNSCSPLSYTGLRVHNIGKKTALDVSLSCDSPKVRLLFREMPLQKVEPNHPENLAVIAEYFNEENGLWYPIGGLPSEQIQSCFEWRQARDLAMTLPVVIRYRDFDGQDYSTACVIRHEGLFLATGRIWCELDKPRAPSVE